MQLAKLIHGLGLDVQLRVLQSLPQLLQNYSDALQGELQSSLLQVCITLQQSKTAAVSGTASAILQQIVSLLYEKVESEDGMVIAFVLQQSRLQADNPRT